MLSNKPLSYIALLINITLCNAFIHQSSSNNVKTILKRCVNTIPSSRSNNCIEIKMSFLDDANEAKALPLSDSDIARILDVKSRFITVPIMILDAMLPGQRMQLSSDDRKFHKLIEYALEDRNRKIGMIGLNPHTGRPLNLGVTLQVRPKDITIMKNKLTISVQGGERFEVQGEPWLDDSGAFYLADIETVEGRKESISDEHVRIANELSATIPELVDDWLRWVIKSGKSDLRGMNERVKDIGQMPQETGRRALWVASLINPIPPLGVCLEIRPAMLACKNDFDRIRLATTALQSSIDHLSGKRRLF